jgi:hypothetical protein
MFVMFAVTLKENCGTSEDADVKRLDTVYISGLIMCESSGGDLTRQHCLSARGSHLNLCSCVCARVCCSRLDPRVYAHHGSGSRN